MPQVFLPIQEDAWVKSSVPSLNLGGSGIISTGNWPNGDGTVHQTHGLWRVNPNTWDRIPPGAVISAATMVVHCKLTQGSEAGVQLRWHRNTGGWAEGSVNWNNKPGFASAAFAYSNHHPGAVGSFRVDSWVNHARFIDGTWRHYGIRSIINRGISTLGGVDFYSSKASSPGIYVDYYAPIPAFYSLVPNAERTALVLSGGGATGMNYVAVTSSADNVHYIRKNNAARPNADFWQLTDYLVAPGPNAPNTTIGIEGGRNVRVNWNTPAQAGVTRYYKFYNVLNDGTWSGANGPAANTLTPLISSYIVQRSVNGGAWTTIYSVGVGTNTYLDQAPPVNATLYYRVLAINSQGTGSAGDPTPPATAIIPPAAPTLTSVTVENDSTFRLSGNGANSLLRIYVSIDGSTYTHQADVQPATSAWNFLIDPNVNHVGNTSPPNPPAFDIQHVAEKAIDLKWVKPTVPATKRWFKVSNVVNNVESALSPAIAATITPTIVGYRVERKLATDSVYSVIYPVGQQTSNGTEDGIRDTGVDFGGNYVYRIIAKSSRLQESTPVMKSATAALPLPPVLMPIRKINNADKSQSVLVSGKGLNGAESIIIQRSTNGGVWASNTSSVILGTPINPVGGEEWYFENAIFNVSDPNVPTWINNERPVDTEGIYLRWDAPTNLATTLSYKANRVKGGVKGQDSTIGTVSVLPFITKYTIYRKEELAEGQTPGPQHEFVPIKTITGTAQNPAPPTRFDHTDPTEVLPSKKYTYKIVATNNFGKNSGESIVKTFSTFDAPPAVKPPPPIPPALENPRPKGALDISGGGTVRLVWDFKHVNGEKQTSYALRVRYSENGVTKTKYWDGVAFVDDATSRVQSANNFADVPIYFFKNGTAYKVAVSARSTQGATGGGIFSSDDVIAAADDTGDSEFLEWDIAGSEHHTVYFSTRRNVSKSYTSYFPLYRKVRTANDDQLALPPLAVSWVVEPQLPFDVNDTKWKGGGNSWIWQVSDRDGRPEPYAELDFEKEGYKKTFKGDSRGRFVIQVPGDLDPGIYTFRERGPTMAPRTTRDFPVIDPAVVYSHGEEHGTDGDDPITGITKEQIADNANIHPSQVQGGAALGDLVDEYGTDIKYGLEKTVSAGHGYYVVDGLSAGVFTAPNLSISAGACWEDDRLKKVDASNVQFLFDGSYKVFVQNGTIRHEIREDYPPRSTPLYDVLVSGGMTSAVITDERLRHGSGVAPTTLEPIHWGVESTDDIKHGDTTLRFILDTNLKSLRDRSSIEEKLHDKFFADVKGTQDKIDNYGKNLLKAREAQLALGYTITMKQLYSYMSRRAAQNLLLDNATALQTANMSDVLNYLSSIADGGFNHSNSHISAFMPKDELSSLTSLLVTNGVARLPNNWTKGTQYTLRTLRVEGAPAQFIEFHLVYEFTKATFDVFGSLANNGRYIPKKMLKTRTVKDDNLKAMFGAVENVYIDTYRAYFDEPGSESVIELLVQGGDPGDGVRLRGFSIVTA